jgi:dihydroorotate dehydrogenase (fumarate)
LIWVILLPATAAQSLIGWHSVTGRRQMDLTTQYLGLTLKNPLIASASPLGFVLENIVELEDKGAAAIVLPSIFEEQIALEAVTSTGFAPEGAGSLTAANSYFPPAASYRAGPERYLEIIRRARETVEIPIIASLNGTSDSGWTGFARRAEQAGAHAIELNIFFIPADLSVSGAQVEQRYLEILRLVKQAVSIPVAVKLSPFFSAPGHFIGQLDDAGADGFVLFNRFYQPDIDLKTLRLERDLALSSPEEIRLPLLWLGRLAGRVRGSLAASTGVETADEVIKYLLVGADTVMTTSALLRHGIGHMATLLAGVTQWLEARGVATLGDIRGRMSQRQIEDPTSFDRANYLKILQGRANTD